MLTLIVYPPAFGAPTASPFCVKAMCLMKASGLAWRPEISSDPRSTPKQKLPVLRDGDKIIPDSDQIRDHLETRYGIDFDEGLSALDRAVSRAVIRMAEENLYFILVCNRWLNDKNWEVTRRALFGQIPKPLFKFVTGKIRKQAIANVNGQGMGRHSVQERADRAAKDLAAIETLLDGKPFLFGDKPSAADMSVVPMLHAQATSPTKTPISVLVTENAALSAYIERGVSAMYP